MKRIDDFFIEVADCMIDNLDLSFFDEDCFFSFTFDKYGYRIKGKGVVYDTVWNMYGDGYYTECVPYLESFRCEINELHISFSNSSKTDKYLSGEQIKKYRTMLCNELRNYIRKYYR